MRVKQVIYQKAIYVNRIAIVNFGDLDRAQRLNEKNRFICHVILFTPRVMVIKMSIMAQFFVFAAHGSKMPVTFWTKYLLF